MINEKSTNHDINVRRAFQWRDGICEWWRWSFSEETHGFVMIIFIIKCRSAIKNKRYTYLFVGRGKDGVDGMLQRHDRGEWVVRWWICERVGGWRQVDCCTCAHHSTCLCRRPGFVRNSGVEFVKHVRRISETKIKIWQLLEEEN